MGNKSKYIFLTVIILSFISCGDNQQYGSYNSDGVSSVADIEKDRPISKIDATKYVPSEVLVKFKAGTAASKIHVLHNALGATKIKEIKHIGIQHIRLPHNMNVEEAVRYYRADPDVEYAEPNYIIKKTVIPNDTGFANLWGLNNTGQTGGAIDADIDAPEAWDITTGSSNVVIAVIDSGVAYNHPDLAGNIWTNNNEVAGNGIDDDGNGYVDDIYGWDFIDSDGYPVDLNSHGTHVAGTIAAMGNNGVGTAGVMWSAKIMPIRFLGVSGSGSIANAVDAIIYAADNGARIINASWGEYDYSNTLYNAINYAGTKDVIFIAAAGNEINNNDINPFYPASFNLANIISVAASDYNDNLASFSNYGANSVHLAAPGVSIYSSIPTFSYGAAVTEYNRNFDSDTIGNLPSGWSSGGINNTWAVTDLAANSAPNSLTDSPAGNYLPNTNSWAGYMTPITSFKNNLYTLSFKWRGHVDPITNDYLNINYSPDGIFWDWVDWTDGNTGGSFILFSTYEITAGADLFDSFYFGFGLETDALVNYDGVYIDDVVLTREPITISGYNYDAYDGTSMAAPHVSGVAGLILSANPSLSYTQVKNIILNNVDPKPSLSGKTLTGGRLNAFSAVSGAIVPNAPSSLTATTISSYQINLSWTDNSTNETGFKIERKTDAGGTYTEIAAVGANVTTYSDTGLSPSTTYYYRIRAYNTAGDSSYSNEASATTKAAPSGGGGGGGGGCSIGKVDNYQTAAADTIIFLMPLVVMIILRRLRKSANNQ